SLVTIAATVGLFGTNALMFREFSVSVRNASRWLYHGSLIRVAGIILSLGTLLLCVSIFAIPKVELELLAIVFIVVFIECNIQLNSSWFKALRKPWLDFLYTMSRSLLVLCAVIVMLIFAPNQYGIAFGYSFGGIIVLSVIFWQWWRPLGIGAKLSFQWRQNLFSALVILLLEVMGSAYTELPQILLGGTATFREVGIYAVYYRFLSPFSLLCISYDQAFNPDLNRLVRTNRDYSALLKRGLSWMGIIGMAAGLLTLAFAPLGILYVAGLGEINWDVVALFSFFPVISGYAAMIDNTLIALRKERYVIFSHAAGIITLILTFFLIPSAGLLKAVVAFLSGFFAKLVVAALILRSCVNDYGISKN
ncbi:MAG TPA: oligosaccharide flippase family protein, partial [Nitrososphaera sp.]|nr:oligosaccharide flippase family protein [Nitrososphaera sp.]